MSESEFGSIDYADLVNESNGSNPVQSSPSTKKKQLMTEYTDQPRDIKRLKSSISGYPDKRGGSASSGGLVVYNTEQ